MQTAHLLLTLMLLAEVRLQPVCPSPVASLAEGRVFKHILETVNDQSIFKTPCRVDSYMRRVVTSEQARKDIAIRHLHNAVEGRVRQPEQRVRQV